ncbi:immune inhibitor A domain-containing protein [Sporichthya sp.]|uniref:immune inhibitor A domain-containing protein n=1 Tax=Sporichthya sp. TaxID=65475 RepID=UPI00185137F1|nr:immune inhibitor A domain-containing protein [Sporichthya sp.]MBA3742123.1 immune inhibitor A [Sporichthya sp.]
MRHIRGIAGVAGAALLIGAAATTYGGAALAEAPSAAAVPAFEYADVLPEELPDVTRYPFAGSVADTLAAWQQTPAGSAQLRTATTAAAAGTPSVGTKRMWPSLDQVKQTVYVKEYTLRGVGKNIEVWVASGAGPDNVVGTSFPAGDCRTVVPNSTTITDQQIDSLLHQYDDVMLPKESKAFSVAPARNGAGAATTGPTAGVDFSGDGNKVVTLVDNVRDPNFYDFPTNQTYVAGFFSRQFNEMTDRNILTIDAYDWAHRTGRAPKHEPNDDVCISRPSRPLLYEGIFAHEYQHLLQYYVDPAEVNFINEGLSDYALTVTGYGDPDRSVFQHKFESHIACYQGFGTVTTKYQPNARPCGGPQNSLTIWGDEGQGAEILADYGIAWSFLLFLKDRYGPKMLEDIHRDSALQGLDSVAAALKKDGKGDKLTDVLHDFQVMTLIDRAVGGKDGRVDGIAKSRVTSASLKSYINLLNTSAYVTPGAAPNGADFVPLRGTGAGLLDGADLRSLSFTGRKVLDAAPLLWSVVPQVPLLPTLSFPQQQGVPPLPDIPPPTLPPSQLDNPALFSGNAGRNDASAAFEVTVPADAPTLSYVTSYNMESGFDYGYTVVSTDGGKTYKSLANSATVPTAAPAPVGNAVTGSSGLPTTVTFDLSPYAGQKVILGFRYLSDPLVNQGGWYIDDVKVGNTVISDGSSTSPFQSFTQIRPQSVSPFTVTLVGLDEDGHRARVIRIGNTFKFALTGRQISSLRSYPVVVAIVSCDDLTETQTANAPYDLKANRITQLGGRK